MPMRPSPYPIIVALCAAAVTTAWAEPLVRHAGEWETTIDDGAPRIVCLPADETLDQNYVTKLMSKLPGISCTISNITTAGNTTSYSMQCAIGGSAMTSSGTITATGPDVFLSKAHSHGGMIKLANGRTLNFPDTDIATVSRRLGPCKPGDRVTTF